MIIGIYANLNRDFECLKSREFARLLTLHDIKYCVVDNAREYFNEYCLPIEEVAKKCDIMAVFGGDGTMLSAANSTMKYETPLLGINMGNLGFLTESDGEDLDDVVDKLASGQYIIEERGTLNSIVGDKSYTSINEVTLARARTQHAIDIEIYVDGKLCDIVTGDGVVVCTPTGSTAYAMSCGGAILSPSLKAIEITAICAHSLHSRPIVVSDDSIVTLQVSRAKKQSVSLAVDGTDSAVIDINDKVTVIKGDKICRLVRLNKDNFYSKLISKMTNWNNIEGRKTNA